MAPLIAQAAAQVATAAIQADGATDKQLFTSPATSGSGGIQSMGAVTVGNRQVGGKGNAAGATSASPTTNAPPSTGYTDTGSGAGLGSVFAMLSSTDKLLLGGAAVALVGVYIWKGK